MVLQFKVAHFSFKTAHHSAWKINHIYKLETKQLLKESQEDVRNKI